MESAALPDVAPPVDVPGATAVRAPMEGSFWSRPGPTDPVFAPPGTVVTAGETIGLVEVMKTFTPIRSPIAGTVVSWRLEDGAPISEGEVIGWVVPAAG